MVGAIEVSPNSLVQVRPRLPVSPRHADPVLVHSVSELRHRFARILLATPGLLTCDAVNNPGVPAVDSRVDGGHHIGHGGPDHLALLDKVTGRAVATFSHALTLSLWPRIGVGGRGNLSSDELLSE